VCVRVDFMATTARSRALDHLPAGTAAQHAERCAARGRLAAQGVCGGARPWEPCGPARRGVVCAAACAGGSCLFGFCLAGQAPGQAGTRAPEGKSPPPPRPARAQGVHVPGGRHRRGTGRKEPPPCARREFTYRAGGIAGELDFVLQRPRSCEVAVLEAGGVWEVTRGALGRMAQECPQVSLLAPCLQAVTGWVGVCPHVEGLGPS
jgi:hypothetical protein